MLDLRTRFFALAKNRFVHFVAIGALVAAVSPKQRDARSIVIAGSQIEDAVRREEARRARPLAAPEKAAAVRALADEEVLAREAIALGIGTDDPVVRARLAARMEATLRSVLRPPSIDEDEIALEVRRVIERAPSRVRLAIWFVTKDRPEAIREAEAIGRAIRADGAEKARGRGERPPIPDGATWTEEELTRAAGPIVGRGAMATPVGEPSEPLPSAWGFYVLVPLERRRAEPAEVRTEAVAALTRAKQAKELRRLLAKTRRDYLIDVRTPAGEPPIDLEAAPASEGVD